MDNELPFLGVCATNYNCGFVLGEHIDNIYSILGDFDFEYVIVDNYSKDNSWKIIERKSEELKNFHAIRKRCKRGRGRNIAYQHSTADYIVAVDTDTIYSDLFPLFIRTYFQRSDLRGKSIRAGFAGIYPRSSLDAIGGWGNLNSDDWDLTVRIWKANLGMKVYPVRMGKNVKDIATGSDMDFLSSRYGTIEKMLRWINTDIERLGTNRRWNVDLNEVYKDVMIDLEFGIPTRLFYTNLDDYTTIRRYLRYLRYKVFMALGIQYTLQKWHEERLVREEQGNKGG